MRILIGVVIGLMIVYFTGTLVAWDFNPGNWSAFWRFWCVCWAIIWSFIGGFICSGIAPPSRSLRL